MAVISDTAFFVTDGTARLCSACQSFFTDITLDSRGNGSVEGHALPHHVGHISFAEAVANGCYVCTAIRADLGEERLEHSQARIYHEYGQTYLEVDLSTLRSDGLAEGHSSTRFILTDVDAHASLYRLSHRSLQQQHTRNSDTIALVKSWLTTCLSEQHTQCGPAPTSLPADFPSRLLDISQGKVRLVETAEHFEPASYVTMSYRWGKEPFLKLTDSNIQDFKISIPLSSMAKSFQDVVTLVRELDIRYIWIDSFCIIQSGLGSKADWHKEGVRMSLIYTNALMNIGCAHGSDTHTGCYTQRQAHIEPPLCVRWRPSPNDPPRLYHLHPLYGISRYLKLYHRSTMFSRAWVFQERILCPRMLYFASDQLYWECSGSGQMLACEEFPAGMRSPMLKVDLYPWSLQRTNSRLVNGEQNPLELWAALVRHYSGLNLTYASEDKLIALGGVARRMAQILDDQYVAGLFRRDMITQLAWVSDGSSGRATSWRAPSWSWASMDGEVEVPFFVFHDLATVQQVDLQHTHAENPFGALVSGSLELICRPIPCDILPRHNHSHFLDIADETIEWHPDGEDVLNGVSDLRVAFTSIFGHDRNASRNDKRLERAELMSIAREPECSGHNSANIRMDGLVLRALDEEKYVRIGAINGSTSFKHLALWYRMKEASIMIT